MLSLKELLASEFDLDLPLIWGSDQALDKRRIDCLLRVLHSCPEIVRVDVFTAHDVNYMLSVFNGAEQ